MPTSLDEFNKWLTLLPWEPWLIPIQKHNKKPDVPEGESWKNSKYRLTVKQAKTRIEQDLNVGVVATGQDFVLFDFDNPKKFMLEKETLTIQTRNGKIHKHYLNGGDVKNADGKGQYKGCGEVRAEWKYVLTPGSYVPPDDKAESGATGLYMVTVEISPATLHTEDLPLEFRPAYIETDSKEKPPAMMAGSFRNQYGWSIEELCKRDRKLDGLLRSQTLTYPSQSEADMACLSKLLFWGYTEGEAVDVLKYFRGRPKLNRKDYVEMTLSKVSHGETIANYVDVSKWNPSTGYGLPFEAQASTYEADKQHKVGLVFKVISKREIKVKAVSGGKSVTGWVTVESPEKLRTSHNAKVLRELLKTAYPKDWRAVLENSIGRVEKAVANWKPELKERNHEHEDVKVDPEIEAEVQKILESSDPLGKIKEYLDNIIAGEDANKLTIFLLLLSGKCEDPRLKQMILLKGEAGGGKTTLMTIADLFKTKQVGRFTEHALDYTTLEGYEVLKLKEIGVIDEEKQGVSTLKFLSAEDAGYIIEFTVKDKETGEFTTKTKRIPAITVISSTTRVALDPQYSRRNWILSPNETEKQTLKIARWIERSEREKAEVLLGLRKETSYSFSMKVLKALVREIKAISIIIPFTKTLLDILDSSSLRVRGDYKKILGLVKFYSILMQNHLPKIPTTNSHSVIVTPEVALEAVNVALGPLTLMTSELDKRTENTLQALNDLGVTAEGTPIDNDVRGKIAVRGGWASQTVRRYLNELENQGYLSSNEKRPKTYRLLYDMSVIRQKLSGISEKMENTDNLILTMRKEAQEWLNLLSVTNSGGYPTIISDIISKYPQFLLTDSELDQIQASSTQPLNKDRDYQKLPILKESNVIWKVENVLNLTRLTTHTEGKCVVCGFEGCMDWQVTKHDGTWGLLCENCAAKIRKQIEEGE